MSAYILINDIPEDCESCIFTDMFGDCILQEDSNIASKDEQREDCPVVPLPARRKVSYKKGYKTGYNDGWNDCLDKITGDMVETYEEGV